MCVCVYIVCACIFVSIYIFFFIFYIIGYYMHYTVGPLLFILYIMLCIYQSQTPNLDPPPLHFPLYNHKFVFYIYESLFGK